MPAIRAIPCPAAPQCGCGSVTIQIIGDGGEITLSALLPGAWAQAFHAEFGAALAGHAPAPADRLHSIRCEGTA